MPKSSWIYAAVSIQYELVMNRRTDTQGHS